METLLSRKIIKLFTVIFLCTILSITSLYIVFKYNQNIKISREIIEQLEESSKRSDLAIELIKESFEDDYLNRLYAIDFILSNTHRELTNEDLEKIAKLMGLEGIYLLDENNIIINTSAPTALNLNLNEYETSNKFMESLKNSETGYYIDLEAITINQQKAIYLGMKSNNDLYKTIQIKIKTDSLKALINPIRIETLISNIPTLYERTYFCIDKKTGHLTAISRNNQQELVFDDLGNNVVNKKCMKEAFSQEELKTYINYLKDFKEPRFVKINGEYQLLVTRNINDKIVGFIVDSKLIYENLFYELSFIIFVLFLIFAVILFSIKYCFRKYVIEDLTSLQIAIKAIMQGDGNIEFKPKYSVEIKRLGNLLTAWKNVYRRKDRRMNDLTNFIDEHFAVFEIIKSLNKGFYTDNVAKILELTPEELEVCKNNPDVFKEYIEFLSFEKRLDNNLIKYKDKYITIQYLEDEDSFYGIISDKTEEINKDIEIDRVKYKAEMDPLTKVGNRVKLERYMEEFFQRDYRRGTLMIFDLDNFKTVNDIGGHPTGDKVLKCFADYLRNHFRQQDLIIRFGGDEFIVFMENKMPLEVLLPKLDRLRNEIEIVLDEYRKLYGVSVSIGIAFVDDRVKNFKEVYKYADVALYIAKRQGKNQYYINENNINCIRDKCINCTENCERRKMILKDKNKK